MDIRKYGRNWAVYDDSNQLICVTVYKKGSAEVLNRLSGKESSTYPAPSITLVELASLCKELSQLSKKFNKIFQKIKSENMLNQAVM